MKKEARQKVFKRLVFVLLGFGVLALLGAIYLALAGFRVGVSAPYQEGVRFYQGLSPIWDGYEKPVLGMDALVWFAHNGATFLRRGDKGDEKACLSYFPLPYYKALYQMYGEEFFKAYSSQFVCLRPSILLPSPETLAPDGGYLLQSKKPLFSMAPVFVKGLRACFRKTCFWVYRIERVRKKQYMGYEEAVNQSLRIFDATLWQDIARAKLSQKQISAVKESLTLPPAGIVVMNDGTLSLLAREFSMASLVDQGLFQKWPSLMLGATPFRVCGQLYSYTGASPTYQQAGRLVLYILFEKECIQGS